MVQRSLLDAQTGQKFEAEVGTPTPTPVGLVKLGWDQPIESVTLPQELTGAQLPRDTSANPLTVQLGAVLAGQILEYQFRATLLASGTATASAQFFGVVAFTAVPVFPDDFFNLIDSSTSVDTENGTSEVLHTCSGRAAVAIPADAPQCTVRVGFFSDVASVWSYSGTDNKGPFRSVSLKASVYNPVVVAQLGPGNLVALT